MQHLINYRGYPLKEVMYNLKIHRNDEGFENFIDTFCHQVHGSGIDYKWFGHKTEAGNWINNAFHCMDENGMYCGNADFSILFKHNRPLSEFRLRFHGDLAQRLARRNQLRDYLEDTINRGIEVALWTIRAPITKIKGFDRQLDPYMEFIVTTTRHDLITEVKCYKDSLYINVNKSNDSLISIKPVASNENEFLIRDYTVGMATEYVKQLMNGMLNQWS